MKHYRFYILALAVFVALLPIAAFASDISDAEYFGTIQVSNNGTDLCNQLGDKAPDRDCLFLRLVIPFASLESNAKGNGLSGLLDSIDFTDANATSDEIQTMQEIRNSLNQVKLLVQKIFVVGEDDRLLSHPGMRQYFCRNAKHAFDYYISNAALFATNIRDFNTNFTNTTTSLGITLNEARELRKLGKDIPAFCR